MHTFTIHSLNHAYSDKARDAIADEAGGGSNVDRLASLELARRAICSEVAQLLGVQRKVERLPSASRGGRVELHRCCGGSGNRERDRET